MVWKARIEYWWWNYIQFPLWHRFGSKESKREIKESLRKRREEGGCSMWQQQLLKKPELAKYDWEKEFVKQTETKEN